MLKEKGYTRNPNSIRAYCIRIGLKCQKPTQYQKGNVPANKGNKLSKETIAKMRAKGTIFEKGHTPVTTKPVGSTRISKDGYLEEKQPDGKWKLKHRIIWQQANGIIPKGHYIVFKDRNKGNVVLSNLECISKKENIRRNTNRKKSGASMKEAWKNIRRRRAIAQHGSVYNAILNGWVPK